MTTRDIMSASRNLLIIYWVISAFCSYQLGIALRVTTKLVGFATFYLGFIVPRACPNPHGSVPRAVHLSKAHPAHLAANPHPHHPHLDHCHPRGVAYG